MKRDMLGNGFSTMNTLVFVCLVLVEEAIGWGVCVGGGVCLYSIILVSSLSLKGLKNHTNSTKQSFILRLIDTESQNMFHTKDSFSQCLLTELTLRLNLFLFH